MVGISNVALLGCLAIFMQQTEVTIIATGELYDQIQKRKQINVQDACFYAAEIVLMLQRLRQEKASWLHLYVNSCVGMSTAHAMRNTPNSDYARPWGLECLRVHQLLVSSASLDHNFPKTSKPLYATVLCPTSDFSNYRTTWTPKGTFRTCTGDPSRFEARKPAA